MAFQDEASAAAQQDQWRTARQFLSAFSSFVGGEQSYAGQDGYAYNPSGQFTVQGPYSSSVEGLPITTTRNGGVVFSPVVVMLALGALGYHFLAKR